MLKAAGLSATSRLPLFPGLPNETAQSFSQRC